MCSCCQLALPGCFPALQPLSPKPGALQWVMVTQGQYLALGLVDRHTTGLGPLIQPPVQIPLQGLPALQQINTSIQLSVISKLTDELITTVLLLHSSPGKCYLPYAWSHPQEMGMYPSLHPDPYPPTSPHSIALQPAAMWRDQFLFQKTVTQFFNLVSKHWIGFLSPDWPQKLLQPSSMLKPQATRCECDIATLTPHNHDTSATHSKMACTQLRQ